MSDSKKQIEEWQEKLKQSFGDSSRLYHYLFETLDNFHYRYLETTLNKNLKTQELMSGVYGAMSFEDNMVEALRNKNSSAFPGIKEMAKSIPPASKPKVRYSLMVEVLELSAEKGKLILKSEINWDFPDYQDPSKRLQKQLTFTYPELAVFRKELALKLEEVCELFN